MKKLVVIGPVYPFKGGISHYTGGMVKNLRKDYRVHAISYKMQYPKILFKKEQRDYDNDAFRIDGAQFLINTANPFNWISVAKKIKEINPDAVIIQWWHPYFSPCYCGLTSLIKKYPVIFVCHNVFPHERFPLDRFLTKSVLKKGRAYITHSKSDTDDLKTIVENPLCETTVLPTFNAFKIRNIGKKEAREEINTPDDKKLLLFFGFVREYKGLKHIIKAMPEIISADSNTELLVVGEFGSDKEDYLNLIRECGVEAHVRIVDGYIPDKEIEKYFASADIVVLPYESATQSGIVQIAYSFEKPVIATRVGGLPDVVSDGKTGYITEPCNPSELAKAVIRYFSEGKAEQFSENVRSEAYRYSWDRMNETVERLLEKTDKNEK